jgi:hypothetical protein
MSAVLRRVVLRKVAERVINKDLIVWVVCLAVTAVHLYGFYKLLKMYAASW